MPKYSIIIPAYNGLPYLKTCINTILSQDYDDYELIVSEDNSTDGTKEYIDSLEDKHIKTLHTSTKMSMAEHWEWALSFASGEWQIFVGQDDGLQRYFFNLADKLTEICENRNINVIMSSRAYYFWNGCQKYYGDVNVGYEAKKKIKIKSTHNEMLKALYKTQLSYMDFPSMYTTSLFKKSFVEYIKEKQNGKLFTTHPQDANLAALVAVFEREYLYSEIPLGWVGSSVKSAGLAISNHNSENKLSNEYLNKTNSSNLKCHKLMGNFLIASHPLYFWGALLTISEIHNKNLYKEITTKKIKTKIFKVIRKEINNSEKNKKEKEMYFDELLKINELAYKDITIHESKVFNKIKNKLNRIIYILREILKKNNKQYSYTNAFSDGIKSMEDASNIIKNNLLKYKIL